MTLLPVTAHVTPVSGVPVTVAENWTVACGATVADAGAIVTRTASTMSGARLNFVESARLVATIINVSASGPAWNRPDSGWISLPMDPLQAPEHTVRREPDCPSRELQGLPDEHRW